ncbi:MAG: hypothetical protein QG559_1051 [Campylobacterota bacterium]|nr:hypothetical protein [Campylobacterota bacterium]MDQ1264050.1 hypothetical protein [Campylobacterota bacterium]MDQ1337782.1 hypothetical protein [Campylobacterota bacterium]
MNVTIEGIYLNGYAKPDYKDKQTGEVSQGDFIVQIQQKKELSNGSVQMEYFDIPVDRALEKQYANNQTGDAVSVLCNVYGENFAQLKIGKAK